MSGVMIAGTQNVEKATITTGEMQVGFLDMLLSAFSGEPTIVLVGDDGTTEQITTESKDADEQSDLAEKICYDFFGIMPKCKQLDESIVMSIVEKSSNTNEVIIEKVTVKSTNAVPEMVSIPEKNKKNPPSGFETIESIESPTKAKTTEDGELLVKEAEASKNDRVFKNVFTTTDNNIVVSNEKEYFAKKVATTVPENSDDALKVTEKVSLNIPSITVASTKPTNNEQKVSMNVESEKVGIKEKNGVVKEAASETTSTYKEAKEITIIPIKEAQLDFKELTFEKSDENIEMTVDIKDLVPQLSKTIETEASKGISTSFKLKLKPEGLGEVIVEMKNESGKLEIVIKTELSVTKELISEKLDSLRAELTTENKKGTFQLTSLTVEQKTNGFHPMFTSGQFTRGDEGTHRRNEQFSNTSENRSEYTQDLSQQKKVSIAKYKFGLVDYLA